MDESSSIIIANQPVQQSRCQLLNLIKRNRFNRICYTVRHRAKRFITLGRLRGSQFPARGFLHRLHFLLDLRRPGVIAYRTLRRSTDKHRLILSCYRKNALHSVLRDSVTLAPRRTLKFILSVLTKLRRTRRRNVIRYSVGPRGVLLQLAPKN